MRWYGNYAGRLDVTYRKGWLEPETKERARENRRYYFQGKKHINKDTPYTTNEVGEVLEAKELICWGFQLTYNDKLPLSVNIILHGDERVDWRMANEESEGNEQKDEREK